MVVLLLTHPFPAFHVLKFESEMESVQSVLVDGFAVAKALRDKHPTEFKLLCETDLDWKYYEKGRSHFHARAPIINLDPHNAGEHTWSLRMIVSDFFSLQKKKLCKFAGIIMIARTCDICWSTSQNCLILSLTPFTSGDRSCSRRHTGSSTV